MLQDWVCTHVELVADIGRYLADPQRHVLLTGLL